MLRNDWTVGVHGVRPAGNPNQCFYCEQEVGQQHAQGCTIRHRTVLVRTIVEHTIDVPENWGASLIEFEEGSSCSNNEIDKLSMLVNRLDAGEGCTCGLLKIEYIREATAGDEAESRMFVVELPS